MKFKEYRKKLAADHILKRFEPCEAPLPSARYFDAGLPSLSRH